MRKLLVVLALAVAPMMIPAAASAQNAPAAPAQGAQPSVQDVVTKVQNFYNQTNTFQADFQQVFHVKAYNQQKNSAGTVIFSKPGKMRWEYSNPAGNIVVSDGSIIKV